MDPKIEIQRVDPTLPLPAFQTEGSVALDLYARMETTIKPGESARVPLNVVIKPPKGYWALLTARSSLHKKGLIPVNGVGIIDPDYCGEEDEYKGALYNISDEVVTIERGERIMQVLFLPIIKPTIQEVTQMATESRGGFGSTGKHV